MWNTKSVNNFRVAVIYLPTSLSTSFFEASSTENLLRTRVCLFDVHYRRGFSRMPRKNRSEESQQFVDNKEESSSRFNQSERGRFTRISLFLANRLAIIWE